MLATSRVPVSEPCAQNLAAAAPEAGRSSTIWRRHAAEPVQLDLVELLGGPPAPRRVANPALFGAAVRDARIARNLTQARAAALAGVSRSALGNIETGTFPAGLGTQVRLATALGLPLAS